MTFRVGQKVVCVYADPLPGSPSNTDMDGLTKGAVYTISEIGPVPAPHRWAGMASVHLVEINRGPCPLLGITIGFACARFRPVKTTSIEIFRAMLVNPPREIVGA